MDNLDNLINLYDKRVRPTKYEPQQQGISYLETERERERERERGGQAYLRLDLGEIEIKRGETEIQIDRET
jgi:hypothetical protein